jgi:hypothetical protein
MIQDFRTNNPYVRMLFHVAQEGLKKTIRDIGIRVQKYYIRRITMFQSIIDSLGEPHIVAAL